MLRKISIITLMAVLLSLPTAAPAASVQKKVSVVRATRSTVVGSTVAVPARNQSDGVPGTSPTVITAPDRSMSPQNQAKQRTSGTRNSNPPSRAPQVISKIRNDNMPVQKPKAQPSTQKTGNWSVKNGQVEKKTFRWQYMGRQHKLAVDVPGGLLDWSRGINSLAQKYYQSRANVRDGLLTGVPESVKQLVLASSAYARDQFTPFGREPNNAAFVKTLAEALKAQAQAEGYDKFQTAEYILSFTQSIPYVYRVYPQLPVQTFVDGGDCDCKSVLLAAIMKELGYKTVLIHENVGEARITHVVAGISLDGVPAREYEMQYYSYGGRKYYRADSTQNLRVGEKPPYPETVIDIF